MRFSFFFFLVCFTLKYFQAWNLYFLFSASIHPISILFSFFFLFFFLLSDVILECFSNLWTCCRVLLVCNSKYQQLPRAALCSATSCSVPTAGGHYGRRSLRATPGSLFCPHSALLRRFLRLLPPQLARRPSGAVARRSTCISKCDFTLPADAIGSYAPMVSQVGKLFTAAKLFPVFN